MAFQEVIFDSRDASYKCPTGAVESGTEITYNLKLLATLEAWDVDLIIVYDSNQTGASYRMTKQDFYADGYVEYTVSVPIYDRGLYWYWFEFSNSTGRLKIRKSDPDNNAVIAGDEKGPWQQVVYKREYKVPEFIKGGIFYHIFVDRFSNDGSERVEMPGKINRTDWGGIPEYRPDQFGIIQNNDFFGGNLRGIIKKLPYIESLGITCIYLSPIFEAFSNHKYDTGDYFKIDPMFGTLEDFRELCSRAKEKNISIILDGVFSHTGSDSIYFDKYHHYNQGGAYRNPSSRYRDWYYFHANESYETWWGIDTLPRVNKYNEDFIDFICGENGVARYWIRQGASGWRLDVVDELPNYFIDRLCNAIKAEREDAIIIGEVWEDASNKTSYSERKNYFQGNRLDSVMNYPFKDALIDFVKNGNARNLKDTVEMIVENYPKDVTDCLMNSLGTHDTVRILTALGGKNRGQYVSREFLAWDMLSPEEYERGKKLLKTALMFLVTLPGVPCIYYADEVGMQGHADPFNRRCFPWGYEDLNLLDWYKRAIHFRKRHSVYADGGYRTVLCDEGAYGFMRYNEEETIITVANLGQNTKFLDIPGSWREFYSGEFYKDRAVLFPDEILVLKMV